MAADLDAPASGLSGQALVRRCATALVAALVASPVGASAGGPEVSTTLFADTYYAHDFNDLPSRERPYTTQAYFNDEYAVSLGFGSISVASENWRGRLAAQYGTSVLVNYEPEPDLFWRYIQEAVVGYRVSPKLWIDAGIYFSHIGSESWISSRDVTYTRSLVADNSPYYQSGIRASYEIDSDLSAQLHLLRGWQNISADESLSLGTQLKWNAGSRFTLTHNTFLGDIHGTRFFNDFILAYEGESGWKTTLTADVGVQEQRAAGGTAWWHGWSLVGQYPLAQALRLGGRVERYADPDKVIIQAVNGKSVNFTGLSANVDWQIGEYLLWRNEYRVLFDTQGVFPNGDGFRDYDQLLVTSLTVQFDRPA